MVKAIAIVGGDPVTQLPSLFERGLAGGLYVAWMVPDGVRVPTGASPPGLGGVLLLDDADGPHVALAQSWARQAHVPLRDPSTPFALESFGASEDPPRQAGTWVWNGREWTWWELVAFRAADSLAAALVGAMSLLLFGVARIWLRAYR